MVITNKRNIEKLTQNNTYYRKVIYTDHKLQIVLMCLLSGEYIPMEKHNGTQFFRIEEGNGTAIVGKHKYVLKEGDMLVVPENTKHQITQRGEEALKLYTIYTPPQHKKNEMKKRFFDHNGLF